MSRLRLFFRYQRLALRALVRRRPPVLIADQAADDSRISHPSLLCECAGGSPADCLADHDPGCKWVPAMCEGCAGTGWCITCGGDGTRPDWDPDKTAPGRPSALRIA